VQDADIIAEKAKLEIADLLPKAQTLYFSENCHSNKSQITLLEADQHVLQHVTQGGSLVIRGDAADAAVLCTSDRTYELREAETSNSLLVLDSLSWPEEMERAAARHVTGRQVTGTFFTYLELRQCRPRVRRLRQLLAADPYRGRLEPGLGYSLHQLEDLVQASAAELTTALDYCHALQLEGQYRALECEYQFHVFSLITKYMEENSWAADRVLRDVTLRTLADLEPRAVLEFTFSRYLQPTGEQLEGTGEQLHMFREEAVARLFAELLLRSMGTFNLADFLASWQQSVPEGVTTSLEQLRGLAVVNREVSPEVVVRLSDLDLPEEVNGRFQALFAVKQLWAPEEMQPYVEDLTSPTLKIGSLLAKHTRLSTRNGVKMHGPKHAH